MTRDEVIRMAREAGLYHFHDSEGHCDGITDARLVTEDKERDDDRLVAMLAPFASLVAAAEREACLGLALVEIGEGDENLPYRVAAAIRARSST